MQAFRSPTTRGGSEGVWGRLTPVKAGKKRTSSAAEQDALHEKNGKPPAGWRGHQEDRMATLEMKLEALLGTVAMLQVRPRARLAPSLGRRPTHDDVATATGYHSCVARRLAATG